jgi:hypothetical protein
MALAAAGRTEEEQIGTLLEPGVGRSPRRLIDPAHAAARQSGWKWSVNLDEKRPAGL